MNFQIKEITKLLQLIKKQFLLCLIVMVQIPVSGHVQCVIWYFGWNATSISTPDNKLAVDRLLLLMLPVMHQWIIIERLDVSRSCTLPLILQKTHYGILMVTMMMGT